MKIIKTGSKYTVCDGNIQTYDQLPVGTYAIGYSQQEGCYLLQHTNIVVREKTYGIHNDKVEKVMSSFCAFGRSLGVILSGDKGIGKSMFAKLLCMNAVSRGLPVVIVDAAVPGIARFIESIDQECVVLFDEFDKTFRSTRDNDDQAALLSLFDGTANGKKLFVVTCNELYGLNDYIINRPGRFHYHFRFEYPKSEDIREYLRDKLLPEYYDEIEQVVSFSHKISLNYDCLRAIAFELNLGISFAEAVSDLNILNTDREDYNLVVYMENGQTLHHYRFRTNLFNNDGTYTWVALYNSAGRAVADLRYDKSMIAYDMSRNATVIPAEGLMLDFEDYDDSDAAAYKNLKPVCMTITKCRAQNLHFAV